MLQFCALSALLPLPPWHFWMVVNPFQHTLLMPFENLSYQQMLLTLSRTTKTLLCPIKQWDLDGLYTQKISCQIAGYFGWHLTCSKIIACKLCAVGKACRWNLRNCSLEDLLHLWMMADSFQHTLSMPFENLSHQQTL